MVLLVVPPFSLCFTIESIDIHVSNATPDIQMSEESLPPSNGVNGVNGSADVTMSDSPTTTTTPGPPSTSGIDTNGTSTYTTPDNHMLVDMEEEEEKPPPAKRLRVYSDADKASIAHVSLVFFPCAVAGVLIP